MLVHNEFVWLQIPKEVIEEKERGQIMLNFAYLSHQKVLKVGIEKATILPSTGSRCANPYVTWYVSGYGRVCTRHIILLCPECNSYITKYVMISA